MNVEHRFYLNGEEILGLPNSEWCDTANPYIYTANKLHWVNNLIKNGEMILIVNKENRVEIKSSDELVKWIQNEFNSPSNGGFERYIENGYK